MRNSLLATIAAAALVTGTIAVSGQGMQGGGAGGGAGGAPSAQGGGGAGGAPSTAPAEKMDRGSPKGGTTGQGTGSQMDRGQSSQPGAAQERGQTGQPQMREQTQPRTGQGQTPQQQGQTGQQQKGQPGTQQQTGQGQTGGASAALTTEQRSRIRTTVLQGGNVNRVSNVNFNIRVGTVVPRSVRLVTVPPAIVEVHPAWRGFRYFVVNDEIVIVEPGTLRIVAVIT
jgi:hypothetical protein